MTVKVETITWYSRCLDRDMTYAMYACDDAEAASHAKLCLAFPPQNGSYRDFPGFGMIEAARPWIESGKITVLCVDGIDGETWSDQYGDPRARIERQERWFCYVTDELLPGHLREGEKAMTTGCSMGATHAGNFFFRRPDLFDGIVALSGIYNAQFFFGPYMDDLLYANSPIHFLPNMPQDHPWIDLYRRSEIILCCGQGAWEDDLLASTRELDAILTAKDVPHWADYWGFDVNHDWPWWRRQLPYFLNHLVQADYL